MRAAKIEIYFYSFDHASVITGEFEKERAPNRFEIVLKCINC